MVEHYRSVRYQMHALTHDELDLVVVGQLLLWGDILTTRQERGKSYYCMKISQNTFLFLYTMGYRHHQGQLQS